MRGPSPNRRTRGRPATRLISASRGETQHMSFEQHDYADGETRLTGLLARPSGTPRAAVLVFPTIMNPTPAVEHKALKLAEAGYLALIADFYGVRPSGFD